MPDRIEKPKVFIASSTRALRYATAVKRHISDVCDARVWEDVPNYPAKFVGEWVLNLPERYDFGVFIFSNDDTLTLNDAEYDVVRDNVLFELGLFAGKLGFDRCTVIRPNVLAFHLPSDLTGILEERFDVPESDGDVASELRVPCENIKSDITQRWKPILEKRRREAVPERIAAICYRRNQQKGLYEFLLVGSSDDKKSRRGFPKKPFNKADTRQPIEVAIEVAAEEGAVKVRKVEKAPEFQPFPYRKEGEKDTVVKYTPFLLEVVDSLELTDATRKRDPKFFTLGEVFTELRSNRNDPESVNSLERVICQCYEFLLRE